MFGLTLKGILGSFEKVQLQLEEFLKVQEEKLQVNAQKQDELEAARVALVADKDKADRVLERVKALIE